MTFYRRDLPHMQKGSRPHFVTFITYQRRVLPKWARDIVLQCCLHDHEKRHDLHAAVVMPDHVHLIFTPLVNSEADEVWALAEIMKGIKGASSHFINKQAGRRGPVWQTESFDHVLRSWEALKCQIEYVRQNPVRKRLANSPDQYPWLWRPPEE